MQSVNNIFSQAMSKTITAGIGALFTASRVKNPGKGKRLSAGDSFKPVLRFAACSDIHLNGEADQEAAVRFTKLFDVCYKYSEQSDSYKGFDAVMVAGDFTGGGDDKEYAVYTEIARNNLREGTQLLTVLGNHEFIRYRDTDATVGYEVYKKHVSSEVDTHKIINGFHFIGVSYDDDGKNFVKKLDWLRTQLDEAVKDNAVKPIFVYQHPHPFATVYGSINWGNTDLRKVLGEYPQVVDFSGHSHYSPSDPRSVWQGAFTAVGCGSLSAFMGNLNYIEGDKDAPGKTGGFRLVEVDADGNILIKLYDIENDSFFDDCEYYITDAVSTGNRNYTWHKQKSLDTPVLFPADAGATMKLSDDNTIILSFPEARGFYPAENYKVTVRSAEKGIVFAKTLISGYVSVDSSEKSVEIGKLGRGDYKVEIIAYSPYAKRGGRIKCNIKL